MEPEKDLQLLHSPWVSTNISRADAVTLVGKLGKGYWEVSSGEPPENTCVTGAQGIKGASQVVKNPPANAGDAGSVPGSGRSGEENRNPLLYSCLGSPVNRGAWLATVHGVTKGQTQRLNSNNKVLGS